MPIRRRKQGGDPRAIYMGDACDGRRGLVDCRDRHTHSSDGYEMAGSRTMGAHCEAMSIAGWKVESINQNAGNGEFGGVQRAGCAQLLIRSRPAAVQT